MAQTEGENVSAYVDTLRRIRRMASSDILDGLIIVVVTTIVVLFLPGIVKNLFSSFQNLGQRLEYLLVLIIIYVSLSRLGFMVLDVWRILSVTARLTSFEGVEGNYSENPNATELYDLMKRENSSVRRIISLVAIIFALFYLQSIEYFKAFLVTIGAPEIFVSNPILPLLPIDVLLLFLIAYNIPVIDILHEKIGEHIDVMNTGELQMRQDRNRCSVCGSTIPVAGVHCPSCGTILRGEA